MARELKTWAILASFAMVLMMGEAVLNDFYVPFDPVSYVSQSVNGDLKSKNWTKIKQLAKGDTKLYQLLKKNGHISVYDQPNMGDYDYNSYPGTIKHTNIDVDIEVEPQFYGPFKMFKRYHVTYMTRNEVD